MAGSPAPPSERTLLAFNAGVGHIHGGVSVQTANDEAKFQRRTRSQNGRAGCALSSPGRTPNRAVDAKKGDTGHPRR